jgi:hypothetical protein
LYYQEEEEEQENAKNFPGVIELTPGIVRHHVKLRVAKQAM